jgi:MFS family permease
MIASNIWKLYIIAALRWFLLIMPTIVLFFQQNGLSMKQVLILQSFFSIAIIVLEIPSGYFSDIVGRRITIVIGCCLGFIGFVVYSFSYGFWGFFVAETLLGFGSSFISGTDSALLYDTLLQLDRTNDYKKVEARLASVCNFSEGTASIVGGLLAVISLRIPFYVETTLNLIVIPLAFSLIEPERPKSSAVEGNFKRILKIVKYSLHEHQEVKWLIIYSALVGASTLTLVWFIQPYLKLVGLPLTLFGITWAVFQFSVGGFSLLADKFEKTIGRKLSLISLIVLAVGGYWLLSSFQRLWSIAFIFIFYFVRGIHVPILKDYVNRLISSDIRATVLSVKNLMGRLVFSIIGPIIGWLTDLYSLKLAFLVAGLNFLICGSIALLFLHKYKAL